MSGAPTSLAANPLAALFRREMSLAFGRGGGPLLACGFYAGVAVLLPLAEGPDPARLAAVAPGAAFATLALASLLSLERLFERDYEDGALDLLSLGTPGLTVVAAVKCLAQWLATGAPLAVAAPLWRSRWAHPPPSPRWCSRRACWRAWVSASSAGSAQPCPWARDGAACWWR